MWHWFVENSQAVSAIASLLTLAVWALYFQILLVSYRRQLRPMILINMGGGVSTRAPCIISNMSSESIYVEAVLIELDAPDRQISCSLSDIDLSISAEADPRPQWFQGPVSGGDFINIGSFDRLIENALAHPGGTDAPDPHELTSLTVTVAATYIADEGLVGAQRAFDLQSDDEQCRMYARSPRPRQIRSRRDRRKLEQILRAKMPHPPQRKTESENEAA